MNIIIGDSRLAFACAEASVAQGQATALVAKDNAILSNGPCVSRLLNNKAQIVCCNIDMPQLFQKLWRALNPTQPWNLLLTHRYLLRDNHPQISEMEKRNTTSTQALVVEGQKYRPQKVVMTCGMDIELTSPADGFQRHHQTSLWARNYAAKSGIHLALMGDPLIPETPIISIVQAFIGLCVYFTLNPDEPVPFRDEFMALAGPHFQTTLDSIGNALPDRRSFAYYEIFTTLSNALSAHQEDWVRFFLKHHLLVSLPDLANRLITTLSQGSACQSAVRLYAGNEEMNELTLEFNRTLIRTIFEPLN